MVGEWEYGLNAPPTGPRRSQISAAGIPVFATLDGVWESSPAHASMYGSVYASLRAAGTMIPSNDVWIASVALVQGAALVTSDSHFAKVAGLQLADWTRA